MRPLWPLEMMQELPREGAPASASEGTETPEVPGDEQPTLGEQLVLVAGEGCSTQDERGYGVKAPEASVSAANVAIGDGATDVAAVEAEAPSTDRSVPSSGEALVDSVMAWLGEAVWRTS
jgi:hypothetical protein